jgi:hypothetical protein
MTLRKLVLAVVLAFGMILGVSIAASAQIELGGALSITKQCGPGVSGTATFDLTATFEGQSQTFPGATVACGATETIPAGTLPVGLMLTLHETIAPSGAVPVADVHITITASDQTVVIVNNPPVSGGLSIHKACPTGFVGTASFSVAFTLAGGGSGGSSSVDVLCGQTKPVTIPARANFTNTDFTVHESSAPLGTNGAADQSSTLSASPQTLTFTDTAAAGPAGVLSIHKTCAPGVSGSATFSVTITPTGATAQSVNVTVACGATVPVTVPASVSLVGAAVTVHETVPPNNGAAAADVTATLSADAQTLTVNNTLHATGALKIHKTCASGVSGTAIFMVTVTPAEATAAEVSVNVPCGQTVVVAIPAAKNVIGAAVKIHESTPPAGGVAAADVTAVLTTADQTLTINNSAAVVAVLAQTGGAGVPRPELPAVFLILGAMLIASGVRLGRRTG